MLCTKRMGKVNHGTLQQMIWAATNSSPSAEVKDMPWWTGKEQIREYLKNVNKNGKV